MTALERFSKARLVKARLSMSMPKTVHCHFEIVKAYMTKALEREIGRTVREKRQQLSAIREESKTFWIILTFWKPGQRTLTNHVLAIARQRDAPDE